MKKYLVKLMFNINIDNGHNASQFDEQYRIIESWNSEDAFYKARSVGKKEEETFLNSENKLVSWQFIDVAEIYPLEQYADGEQLYSSTHSAPDSSSYIDYIRQRSMEIQSKSLTFA